MVLPAVVLVVVGCTESELPAVSHASSDLVVIGVDADDLFGHGVGSGDVNNDGVDDLVISAVGGDPRGRNAAGETYVFLGPLSGRTIDPASADMFILGIEAGDQSGVDVAVGDLDNDGVGDLVIGAKGGDPGGKVDAGETYVLFGPLSAGTIDLRTVDPDVTITGIAAGDFLGQGVAVGDINGDGVDDLLMGALLADPGDKTDAGQTHVIFGPLSAGVIDLAATAPDITVRGIGAGDLSGIGLDSGDVNNDGQDDLVIGAATADPGGKPDAGETYVLFGPLSAGTIDLATNVPNIAVEGADPADFLGNDVAIVDVNGDGKADLVLSVPLGDPGGRIDSGETIVLFGPLAAGTIDLTTAAIDVTLNGIDPGDGSALGLAGGDVDNDGNPDLIIGAFMGDPPGKKRSGVIVKDSNAGEAYVLFGPLSARTIELSRGL